MSDSSKEPQRCALCGCELQNSVEVDSADCEDCLCESCRSSQV